MKGTKIMKTVNVEMWSDFVCPWCWIAKRRLETAIAALAGQVEVSVTSRSYRLAKGMAPAGFAQALHQKFGNREMAMGMMAAVGENGRAEGLVYNFDTMRFGDTSDAHALIRSIAAPELAARVAERLYKAGTTDGIDIFDRAALRTLARDAGAADIDFDFDSPAIAAGIADDEARANQIANGVPLFVFNNSFYLSGAQPASVFQKALTDAAIDRPDPLSASGAFCTVDGCAG